MAGATNEQRSPAKPHTPPASSCRSESDRTSLASSSSSSGTWRRPVCRGWWCLQRSSHRSRHPLRSRWRISVGRIRIASRAGPATSRHPDCERSEDDDRGHGERNDWLPDCRHPGGDARPVAPPEDHADGDTDRCAWTHDQKGRNEHRGPDLRGPETERSQDGQVATSSPRDAEQGEGEHGTAQQCAEDREHRGDVPDIVEVAHIVGNREGEVEDPGVAHGGDEFVLGDSLGEVDQERRLVRLGPEMFGGGRRQPHHVSVRPLLDRQHCLADDPHRTLTGAGHSDVVSHTQPESVGGGGAERHLVLGTWCAPVEDGASRDASNGIDHLGHDRVTGDLQLRSPADRGRLDPGVVEVDVGKGLLRIGTIRGKEHHLVVGSEQGSGALQAIQARVVHRYRDDQADADPDGSQREPSPARLPIGEVLPEGRRQRQSSGRRARNEACAVHSGCPRARPQ